VHPASHNSLTATRLCVMLGIRKARLAAFGNLASSSSTVCVVSIDAPFGMPRDLFFSCISAILHSAFCPTSDMDAAESMNADVFR